MPSASTASALHLQLLLRQQTPAINQAAQQNARNAAQPLFEKQRAELLRSITQQHREMKVAKAAAKGTKGASAPTAPTAVNGAKGASTPRRGAIAPAVKAPPLVRSLKLRAFPHPDMRGDFALGAARASALFACLDDESDEETAKQVPLSVHHHQFSCHSKVLLRPRPRPCGLLARSVSAVATSPALFDEESPDEETARATSPHDEARSRRDQENCAGPHTRGTEWAGAFTRGTLTMAPSGLRCLDQKGDQQATPPPVLQTCTPPPRARDLSSAGEISPVLRTIVRSLASQVPPMETKPGRERTVQKLVHKLKRNQDAETAGANQERDARLNARLNRARRASQPPGEVGCSSPPCVARAPCMGEVVSFSEHNTSAKRARIETGIMLLQLERIQASEVEDNWSGVARDCAGDFEIRAGHFVQDALSVSPVSSLPRSNIDCD